MVLVKNVIQSNSALRFETFGVSRVSFGRFEFDSKKFFAHFGSFLKFYKLELLKDFASQEVQNIKDQLQGIDLTGKFFILKGSFLIKNENFWLEKQRHMDLKNVCFRPY